MIRTRCLLPLFALFLLAADRPQGDPEVEQLRQKIDANLREELTKHWYPAAIDRDLGGFHQNFARDWSPLRDDNRFLVPDVEAMPEREQEAFLRYVYW